MRKPSRVKLKEDPALAAITNKAVVKLNLDVSDQAAYLNTLHILQTLSIESYRAAVIDIGRIYK